jgi:hypothetical protein
MDEIVGETSGLHLARPSARADQGRGGPGPWRRLVWWSRRVRLQHPDDARQIRFHLSSIGALPAAVPAIVRRTPVASD